jgi:hypothetical protein
MTSSNKKKSKSSGWGCLWPLALGLFYLVPSCEFTTSSSIDPNTRAQLSSEAEQIRSQFQGKNCDQLLQDIFGNNDDSAADVSFLDLCNQKADEYATAQSISFQTGRCESVSRPFKDEKFTTCTLEYEVILADETILQETYLWLLENGQHQFVEVAWEEI